MDIIKNILRKFFFHTQFNKAAFQYEHYQRHNQRRLEHLASLQLNIHHATVLEVGAGIGDHTGFFIDRHCLVTSTDVRNQNLKILRSRYPKIQTKHLNLDSPSSTFNKSFDIIYCYGVLYHLKNPTNAIQFMSYVCKNLLLLETCVSYGEDESINPVFENSAIPSESISGQGCRPTRTWVFNQLRKHFEYVYVTKTQPNHEEFPINWVSPPPSPEILTRTVFVASRKKLTNPNLSENILMQQGRH